MKLYRHLYYFADIIEDKCWIWLSVNFTAQYNCINFFFWLCLSFANFVTSPVWCVHVLFIWLLTRRKRSIIVSYNKIAKHCWILIFFKYHAIKTQTGFQDHPDFTRQSTWFILTFKKKWYKGFVFKYHYYGFIFRILCYVYLMQC